MEVEIAEQGVNVEVNGDALPAQHHPQRPAAPPEVQFDLGPFLDPVVPGPLPEEERLQDVEGWGSIDGWGAWDCAISHTMPLEEVPGPYKVAWSRALAKVLGQIVAAQTPAETDRALKWLLVLPSALLREPKRGGQRGQGSGEVARRFEAVRTGDWGTLLSLLKQDDKAEEERRRRKDQQRRENRGAAPDPVKEQKMLRKTVLALISRGQVGKARRRISSHGLASMADPAVKAAMAAKYPPRRQPMPGSVVAGTCVDSLPGLREVLQNLQPGVSAGFGGMRNEFLRCAGENWDDREVDKLERFSLLYLNGLLPPWLYKVWGSVTTHPLYKTKEKNPSKVRPIGVKTSMLRALHSRVVIANRGALREHLEPHQIALTPGGGGILAHTVRMLLELRPDFVCVCLDVRNAHNEVSRSAVVAALEKVPGLRHLAQHVATCLAAHHSLESGGNVWGEAADGLTQGDGEASPCYCVGWHEHVVALSRKLEAAEGLAIFGNDDGYAIGPPEIVFDAMEQFRSDILAACSLTLQKDKTKIYHQSGLRPPQAPADMPLAGEEVDGRWLPGFTCYGVEIGCDAFVKHKLDIKVAELVKEVDDIMELLAEDKQAAWTILSTAVAHQLDYSLTLQYPTDMLEGAAALDARIWQALEQLAGQERIPRGEEGLGVECVVDLREVPQLQGRSYQHLIVPQPVKLGGCGLRSLSESRHSSFLRGVEQSLPHTVAREVGAVLCPSLQQVVGSLSTPRRWEEFLIAGSRTAREFQGAWTSLSSEAHHMWNFLQEEPSGPLAAAVQEVGGTSVDGSTATKAVQQLEGLRHKTIGKALINHPDRRAKPVTVFPNIADDKVAGRWLLAGPGADNGLSSPVFQECLSRHLCLPSPAIKEGRWEGKTVGRGILIDKYGDAVVNCSEVIGDTWRRRHDLIKQRITTEALLAGVHVDCEVYGLFADLLPAALTAAGGELQWGRARQGLVPDFKLLQNTPEGPSSSLAELKTIGAGNTWYPQGQVGKGTERRAAQLVTAYEKSLWKYDVRFHGTLAKVRGQPDPPPGPLVRRLRSYGRLQCLVAGPYADLSDDFHELLLLFAETKAAKKARARGWECEGDLGQIMGEIRRAVSVSVVRAHSLCLLERLAYLGPGARAAGQRRQLTMQLEEGRRREVQAYRLARAAHGIRRVGRAFVP